MFLKYLACSNDRIINTCILLSQDSNPTKEEVDAEKKVGTKPASYEQQLLGNYEKWRGIKKDCFTCSTFNFLGTHQGTI